MNHLWFLSMCVFKLLSCIGLFATPGTVAYNTPLSRGFLRREYWSGLQFLTPGDLSPRGWTRVSCTCRQILYHWATWEAVMPRCFMLIWNWTVGAHSYLQTRKIDVIQLAQTKKISPYDLMLPEPSIPTQCTMFFAAVGTGKAVFYWCFCMLGRRGTFFTLCIPLGHGYLCVESKSCWEPHLFPLSVALFH